MTLSRWFAPMVVAAALASSAAGASTRLAFLPGQPIPDLAFDALVAPEDYGALGLTRKDGPFRLSEIPGDVLVFELFNQFCLTCRRQAPHLQSVFEQVTVGPLAGRVRLLALGVGNRLRDLARFRDQVGVSYPMAADPFFDRMMDLGDTGGTPFVLYLVRRQGGWVPADYQLGLEGDTEIMARVSVFLEGTGEIARAARDGDDGAGFRPPLGLDPGEQRERVRTFLTGVAGRPVKVDEVTTTGGVRVYRALGTDGLPTGLYGRIASRDPVCDVCHAVHFLLAFDREGRVRGFEPVHVTKYGNAVWTDEEAARMRATLVGRPMEDLAFDPTVDAVSTATMSSALIFDEARRSARLLGGLESQ